MKGIDQRALDAMRPRAAPAYRPLAALAVAVIQEALDDLHSPQVRVRAKAAAFFRSPSLEDWCVYLDQLNAEAVRECLRRQGQL